MPTLGGIIRSDRRGTLVRRVVLLLAAACTGYVAEAEIRSSIAAPPNVSAIAESLHLAQTLRDGAQVGAWNLATSWIMGESFWVDAGRIQDPRECDLPGGIAKACLFMD